MSNMEILLSDTNLIKRLTRNKIKTSFQIWGHQLLFSLLLFSNITVLCRVSTTISKLRRRTLGNLIRAPTLKMQALELLIKLLKP